MDIEPPIIGKGLDWFEDQSFRNGTLTRVADAPAPEPAPKHVVAWREPWTDGMICSLTGKRARHLHALDKSCAKHDHWFSQEAIKFYNAVTGPVPNPYAAPAPPPPEPPKPVTERACIAVGCKRRIPVVSGKLCPSCEAAVVVPCNPSAHLPRGTWTPSPGFCAPMLSRGRR